MTLSAEIGSVSKYQSPPKVSSRARSWRKVAYAHLEHVCSLSRRLWQHRRRDVSLSHLTSTVGFLDLVQERSI
jgi:hypothetical protein